MTKANGKTARKSKAARIPDDAKIKLLKKGNQRRAGSKASKRYALYKDGMTVADYIAAGKKTGNRTSRSNIRNDVKRGNIALELPGVKKVARGKEVAKVANALKQPAPLAVTRAA